MLDFRYSSLSAATGSTLVALRAGTKQDANAARANKMPNPRYVAGSVGWIPNSKVDMKRDSPNAPPAPSTIPTSAGNIPCRTICLITVVAGAPRATLIPISEVRRATV